MSSRPKRATAAAEKPKAVREKRTRPRDEDIPFTQQSVDDDEPPRPPPPSSAVAAAELNASTLDADERYGRMEPFAVVDDPTTIQTAVLFGRPQGSRDDPFDDNRDPRQALSRPGVSQILDMEEAVRRQLPSLFPDAQQANRLFVDDIVKKTFVVAGLSQFEPNPKYAMYVNRRRALEEQRIFLERERQEYDDMFYRQHIRGPKIFADYQRASDAYRMAFLDGYRPPQLMILLTPSFAIADRNNYYRTLFADVLNGLRRSYKETSTLDAVELGTRFYSNELFAYHVRPILDRHAAELRASTFEDMPYTNETVHDFFNKYTTAAYNRYVRPAVDPRVEPYVDVIRDEHSRDDAASSLGRAFKSSDHPEATRMAYYLSVIALHASREYRGWLREWKLKNADAILPVDLIVDPADDEATKTMKREATKRSEDAIAKLDQFVEQLVRAADRNMASDAEYVHAHRPLSEKAYKNDFRRMLFLEIAAHRAANLPKREALVAELTSFLSSMVYEPFNEVLLLNLPLDFPLALDEARNAALASVPPSYDAAGIQTEEYNSSMVAEVDKRYAEALAAMRKLWPAGEQRYPHAPNDPRALALPQQPIPIDPRSGDPINPADLTRPAIVDPWSPFDLSYPLDRELTRKAEPAIADEVAILARMFDINDTHERANERRVAFGAMYANRRLAIELSQAEYLLKNVLTEQVEVPLVVTRMLYDTSDLVLEVRLELSPLLASRIAYVPPADRLGVDSEAKDALDRLSTSEFQVTWLHRSKYTGTENRISVGRLDRASQSARLQLSFGNRGRHSAQPETILALAGTYRVQIQQIDRNTNLPAGEIFNSLFTATVHVVAECMRDHKLFTPEFASQSSQNHKECRWRPLPPDERHMQHVKALELLVTRGLAEYQEYLLSLIKAPRGLDLDDMVVQALPPWGETTGANLHHLSQQTPDTLHRLFYYRNVIQRFIERFAENIRYILKVPRTGSDLVVFGQLAAAHTRIYSGNNLAVQQLAQPADLDSLVYDNKYASAQLGSNMEKAKLLTALETPFYPSHWAGTIDGVPMAELVAALRLPFMAAWQTGRERRFIEKLAGDVAAFGKFYTRAIANEERIPAYSDDPGYTEARATDYFRRIKAELDTMPADAIHNAIIDHRIRLPDLFYDTRSEQDLLGMIKNLRTTLDGSNIQNDVDWLGKHSFVTDQPSLAIIGKTKALAVAASSLPRALVLVRRGSEPTNRGYDYGGLHHGIEQAIAHYNRLVASGNASLRDLTDAYVDAGRRITVYNYFAFLATPLPLGEFMRSVDIDSRVHSGFYSGRAAFVPTPPIDAD